MIGVLSIIDHNEIIPLLYLAFLGSCIFSNFKLFANERALVPLCIMLGVSPKKLLKSAL